MKTEMRYPGDEAFTQMLQLAHCPLPLWRIKTTLLGAIAATNLVFPHHLLPLIWKGRRPGFESQNQAEAFFSAFTGLWNELTGLQTNGQYRLWLVKGESRREGIGRYFQIRQDEMAGFRAGLDAGGTDPARMTKESLNALKALATADAFLEKGQNMLSKEGVQEAEISDIIGQTDDLDRVIQESMERIVQDQAALRQGRIPNRP